MNRCVEGRLAGVVAGILALQLGAGCAAGAGADETETRAPEVAGARPASVPPILLRSPETSRYRLTIDSDEGRGPQTLIATFDLETPAEGPELVTLLTVARGPQGGTLLPLTGTADARRAFGGDERDGGAIGRFAVPEAGGLDGLVPPEFPEPVFGAVADLLGFLSVQSEGFGADRLLAAGDVHRFQAFEESWRHPPRLLGARIRCPGGALALTDVRDDEAVLQWRPDAMPLALLRSGAGGGPGGEPRRMLLAGTESLVLEVRCDPRTGRLLAGRSLRDDLDLRLWMEFAGGTLPEDDAIPRSGGIAVAFRRSLVLERVASD